MSAKGLHFSLAVAVRAAARVLPLLAAERGGFKVWRKDARETNWLAVMRAVSTAEWVAGAAVESAAAANAADGAARDAYKAAMAAVPEDDNSVVDGLYVAPRITTVAHSVAAIAQSVACVAAAAATTAAPRARRPRTVVEPASDAADVVVAAFDAADPIATADALNDTNRRDVSDLLSRPLWRTPNPHHLERKQRFLDAMGGLDSGFALWSQWYEALWQGRSDGTFAEKAAWVPREVLAQDAVAINAYLRALMTASTQPLNRVRAILIGNGGTGKTSIIRALHGEPVVPGEEPMTAGIDIRSWPLPGTDIRVDFWDFGGQVMAHATHQLFLRERCVYVVVLQGRNEVNLSDEARYWLEHVRAFGGNAPALIVGNKCDQVPVSVDERALRDKYNVTGFYPLSCTQRAGARKPEWERFERDLAHQLQAIGTHQLQLTKPHFGVLEELMARSQHETLLESTEFYAICKRHGVRASGELDREWLRDLLDKLGIIVSFPKLPYMSSYLLNPQWLTYGIYALFYAERSHRQFGRLSDDDVRAILSEREFSDNLKRALRYTPEHCGFIRSAMLRFRLCYELPGGDMILPALLPADAPPLDFDQSLGSSFEFQFESFVPRHVMAELIVRRHGDIIGDKVWQEGAVLFNQSFQAQALTRVDHHERRLSLWVTGTGAGRFLSVLYDEIREILQRMPNLRWAAYIGLSESARMAATSPLRPPTGTAPRAPYEQILAHEAAGASLYICEHGHYSVAKVLSIMLKEQHKSSAMIFHVNNSQGVQIAVDGSQATNHSARTEAAPTPQQDTPFRVTTGLRRWIVPLLVAATAALSVPIFNQVVSAPCEEGKQVACPATCPAGREPKKLCSLQRWGSCECQPVASNKPVDTGGTPLPSAPSPPARIETSHSIKKASPQP